MVIQSCFNELSTLWMVSQPGPSQRRIHDIKSHPFRGKHITAGLAKVVALSRPSLRGIKDHADRLLVHHVTYLERS